MRFYIFLLCLIFSFDAASQVGKAKTTAQADSEAGKELIGTAKIGPAWVAELVKYEMGDRDLFVLTYKNNEYQTISDIQSISFNANNEEIEYVFNELKSVLKTQEEKTIMLGEYNVQYKPFMKKNISIAPLSAGKGFFVVPGIKVLHELFGKPFNRKIWNTYLKN